MKQIAIYLLVTLILLAGVHLSTFSFVNFPLDGCENQPDNFTLLCNFSNPEDLIRSPVKGHIIVSEFNGGESGSKTGQIVSLDVTSSNKKILFPSAEINGSLNHQDVWGEKSCTEPPQQFSPHGIDLIQRADKRYALYVVNHGNREAVEIFEFVVDTHSLLWKGCVVSPQGHAYNDVAGLTNGGFYVSSPYADVTGSDIVAALQAAFLNAQTGYVAHWSPNKGYQPLSWTRGSHPNGVQVSKDQTTLYINQYFEESLVKYDIKEKREVARVEMLPPDNINWTQDGYLLSTSHQDWLPRLDHCLKKDMEYCPIATKVYKVDPQSLEKQIIFASNGDHFGFGTGAIDIGDTLLIGTASGNRLAIVKLNSP